MSDNTNTVIGNLKPSASGPWVTFKEAKQQIRDAAKAAGIKLGAFRPRSVNKAVLQVQLADGSGHITAQRKPNATIEVVKVENLVETNPELVAQIEAELGTQIKREF